MGEERKQPGIGFPQQEAAWIRSFLAGERDGFDALVLSYKDRIFNLCFRLLDGDHEEANDSAQETFVKMYRSLNQFRFDSSFSTWIYAIAVNTCKNKLKSAEFRNRKRRLSLDPVCGTGECASFPRLEDPAPSPLAQLEAKERQALVHQCIDALPEDARELIVLRDIEGFSYEEITLITGYHLGTVKSKLARARRRLCEALKGA